jgi:phosphomannomutase
MPEISRFYGIVVRMFFNDHTPPHFHAEYGGEEVIIAIGNLATISGKLPARAMGLLIEWATLHQAELHEQWERMRRHEAPSKIDPLP